MHRVLICGARDWTGVRPMRLRLERLIKRHGVNGLIVIQGGAPGADAMAHELCDELNVHCAEVNALWNHRHRSAGPQRNRAMLGLQPHEVIAFHKLIGSSRGTADMVRQAHKAGIPVEVVKR